jgi:vacuolar-type H+-ATPase catalytic subunit A/Vma1
MKKVILYSKPLAILFASMLMSCSKTEDKQKKMIDDVMAVHDEVMPKMDEIMNLKSSLDSAVRVSPDSLKARELYVNPDQVKGKSADEVTKYYENEKNKITEVRELTNASIEQAKVFLKK